MIVMRNERGFTLVELMVALVLGLLVTAAVLSVYLSNRQAFRTAENMARLQENARFAFEALAREIREAGGNPCGAKLVANVLNNNGGGWWAWQNGPLKGYDDNEAGPKEFGSGSSQRVNGTDGILLVSANLLEGVLITEHNPNSAQFKVNTENHGIHPGDIVMACDGDSAAIFQVTNANKENKTVVHNTGTGVPGNCSKGLGYPTVCTTNGTQKTFANGGNISKYSASFWYIGNNSRGSRSLYRLGFTGNPMNQDNQPNGQADEIAEGVTDMQIEYLERDASGNLGNAYKTATDVANWGRVVAVRMTLTLETQDKVGTNNQSIQRTFIYVTGVRNRLE